MWDHRKIGTGLALASGREKNAMDMKNVSGLNNYLHQSQTWWRQDDTDQERNDQLLQLEGAPPRDGEGQSTRAAIRERVNKILEDVEPGPSGKITMDDVLAKKDEYLHGFDESISNDLKGLGVDESIEFTLSMNSANGRIQVQSDHPDKRLVELYLQEHPELCEKYARIQTLANVTRMSEEKLSLSGMRKELQMDAAKYLSSLPEVATGNFSPLYMSKEQSGLAGFFGLNMSI